MDDDSLPLGQTSGQGADPDSSNVKREPSEMNESQVADSQDGSASRILSGTPEDRLHGRVGVMNIYAMQSDD